MSIKSQTNNMRRLAALLDFDLCDIHGKRNAVPTGASRSSSMWERFSCAPLQEISGYAR